MSDVSPSVPPPGPTPGSPPPAVPSGARPKTVGEVLSSLRLTTAVALLGAIIMAIGSLGPWVDTILGSVSGTHGDGQITLVAAGAAFLFTLIMARQNGATTSAVLAILSAVGGGAVGVYDFEQIRHATSEATLFGTHVAQAGWGLYAVIGGAVVVIGGIAASATR